MSVEVKIAENYTKKPDVIGLKSLDKDANPKQSKKRFERVTFALKNPIQIDYVIKVLESEFDDTSQRSKYLYILHDKDKDADGNLIDPHLHVIVWGNARRFVDWANQFSDPNDPDNAIPPHMISGVMNVRSMARYLIHKDNSDKFQYSSNEVQGSKRGLEFFHKSLIDSHYIDAKTEIEDFSKLRAGLITPSEFLKKYSIYYSSDRFSTRLRLYSSVFENFNVHGDFGR